MTTTDIASHLSPGQQNALDAIEKWYHGSDEQVFRLFGPAGTGKTTIARLVPELLGLDEPMDIFTVDGRTEVLPYHFGAFSGKAVNVLRTKGCVPAGTLHSLIYGPPFNLKEFLRSLQKELDEQCPPEDTERAELLRAEIASVKDQIKRNGALLFGVNDSAPLFHDRLLIADEVSMVNGKMADDILSFGCKVLVLGDPFQLPPVRGDGVFMDAAPDVMLTEVHRQALDSPILELATRIRTGAPVWADDYQRSMPWHQYDVVLSWKRATRWNAVRAIRNMLGRPADVPAAGDRVMCLANNKKLRTFNGQTWTVVGTETGRRSDEVILNLVDDGVDPSDPDARVWTIPTYLAAFTEENEKSAESSRIGSIDDPTMLATFAQALTVHKAQGSEWPNVLVMDESSQLRAMEANRKGFDEADRAARRWLYTAVTRASNSVGMVQR